MNLINELASLLIFINATLFYIFIFGREIESINRLPLVEQWLLRIGLAMISIGGFYNVMIVSYPPNVEIFINVGYACLFTWASIFHYKTFIKK